MKHTQIALPYKIKNRVLALGAQSKAGFCFAEGNTAYLSESSGDLSDLENFEEFKKQIKIFQKKIKIKPEVIACDLHPEYISAKYAREWAKRGMLKVESVQHHEAHVASCIADNSVRGNVIGVAFDGTGFGLDGNIWGGEFFIGDVKKLKRAAHLKYIPMPGAEAAIKEPWRMAFSYLYNVYGKKRKIYSFARASNDILSQMIDKKINSPLTSSMGRLFDGVSSLIGVCDFASYEGEAAIKLEKIIGGKGQAVKGGYEFRYAEEGGMIIINWKPVITGIVKDLKFGVEKSRISLKFHNAVCDMIKDVCISLRKKYKIKKVCLSGGVFQNKYLIQRAKPMLEKEGFNVYGHERIPTHDGGIAIGQAVLAGV
jgi:hydrogenase maturation protein HypF